MDEGSTTRLSLRDLAAMPVSAATLADLESYASESRWRGSASRSDKPPPPNPGTTDSAHGYAPGDLGRNRRRMSSDSRIGMPIVGHMIA